MNTLSRSCRRVVDRGHRDRDRRGVGEERAVAGLVGEAHRAVEVRRRGEAVAAVGVERQHTLRCGRTAHHAVGQVARGVVDVGRNHLPGDRHGVLQARRAAVLREKDRARRYETANGLGSDLQRHLNNEAVLARPPSAAYRFQKMVQRNKLAVAAVTSVAAVLVLGVVGSAWQAFRATQAKREAVEAQRKEAEQRESSDKNAEKARQAEQKAESAAAAVTRNLYFAEMNLAGVAAAEPGGISRIADLTARWRPEKGATDKRGWEWYYLRSLMHLDLFTLIGHTNDVNSVAWSPDGKRLASGFKRVMSWMSYYIVRLLRGMIGYARESNRDGGDDEKSLE